MSSQLGSQVIASGSDSTFSVPSDGIKAILIGNESGLTCTVTMESGGVSKTLYPSTLDWFQVNRGFNGTIRIHPYTILSNVATFPASSLIFDAISVSDPEQASMYPLQLTRNTNVGNSINTTLGTASAVQNDGATSGTSVVEATVLGDSASAVSITNNGHATFGSTTNNGLLEVIGAAGNVTIHSTGEMDIDYKLLCNLIIAELGNDFTIDVATGHKIALQNNGSDMVDINGSGLSLISGAIHLLTGSISRIALAGPYSTVVSPGSFFNHNLGSTPDVAIGFLGGLIGAAHAVACEQSSMTSTQVKLSSDTSIGNVYVLSIKF